MSGKSYVGHSHRGSSDIGPSRVNVGAEARGNAPKLAGATSVRVTDHASHVVAPKTLAGSTNDRHHPSGNLTTSSIPSVRGAGSAISRGTSAAHQLGKKR